MQTIANRLGFVCVLLTGVTLLSWWLGANDGLHPFALDGAITVGVVLMAALKVRLIVFEFMELRHAPPRLQRIADGALGGLFALLLLCYFAGRMMPA